MTTRWLGAVVLLATVGCVGDSPTISPTNVCPSLCPMAGTPRSSVTVAEISKVLTAFATVLPAGSRFGRRNINGTCRSSWYTE